MSNEKSLDVRHETSTPLRLLQTSTTPIWPTDPWDHAEPGERIEEALHLNCVHRRQAAVRLRWTKMRKNICNMVTPQSLCEVTDPGWITKMRNLISLAIPAKPVVSAQPAVPQPNGVTSEVVPSIVHIETWSPKEVSKPEQEQQRASCRNCS